MALCKQEGIFIERPDPVEPVDECVYAMSVDIGVIYEPWQGFYDFGQTVMYMIYVENIGTCELTDIVATDETGGSEFTIPVLAPGEIQEFYSEYVVTSSDIVNQEIYLFVSADSAETHAQTHMKISTQDVQDYLYLTFDSNESEWAWTVGENVTIELQVSVGINVDLKYVEISLSDIVSLVTEEIPVMVVGEERIMQLTHTITQDDIDNGFTAYADARWLRPDGERNSTTQTWRYRKPI